MSGWLQGFLLALAPLLILVGLLILGRYPGEEPSGNSAGWSTCCSGRRHHLRCSTPVEVVTSLQSGADA